MKTDLPAARTAAAVRERIRDLIPGTPVHDLRREGGTVLAGGLAGGIVLAAGCWRLVRNQVYGVDTTGMVLTLGEATIVLVGMGIFAIGLPAWRARTVAPAVTLRGE